MTSRYDDRSPGAAGNCMFYSLTPVTGTYLAFAILGQFWGVLFHFNFIKPCFPRLHRLVLVLVLWTLVWQVTYNAGGEMRDSDETMMFCLRADSHPRLKLWKLSISISPGFYFNFWHIINFQSTATVAVDVCILPLDSVDGTLWTRWTPLSNLRRL